MIPRNHFLYVHDALRSHFGASAKLSAFVKSRKPFQCEMVINHRDTDPNTLKGSVPRVQELCEVLQPRLDLCDLQPAAQRLDINFRDGHVIRLALGAALEDLDGVRAPPDINREPDWRRRDRLRISVGFDVNLFIPRCNMAINLAAASLEKVVYDRYVLSGLAGRWEPLGEWLHACGGDWEAACPPQIYWKVHGYALTQQYPCNSPMEIASTVERHFAMFYGKYPFDNPFCAGEDLNTMRSAELLCRVFKQAPLEAGSVTLPTVQELLVEEEEGKMKKEKVEREKTHGQGKAADTTTTTAAAGAAKK